MPREAGSWGCHRGAGAYGPWARPALDHLPKVPQDLACSRLHQPLVAVITGSLIWRVAVSQTLLALPDSSTSQSSTSSRPLVDQIMSVIQESPSRVCHAILRMPQQRTWLIKISPSVLGTVVSPVDDPRLWVTHRPQTVCDRDLLIIQKLDRWGLDYAGTRDALRIVCIATLASSASLSQMTMSRYIVGVECASCLLGLAKSSTTPTRLIIASHRRRLLAW